MYHGNRLCLWTDVVGADLPEGIHHARIAVEAKDVFLCPADGEFALSLDASGIGEAQGAEAGLSQICLEDIPPFAKIGFPHLDAVLEV